MAFTGAFVAVFTEALTAWKLETCYELMDEGRYPKLLIISIIVTMNVAMISSFYDFSDN